jgi:hypothetical protein
MSSIAIKGNQAKYLSYRLAHERMKAAIQAGFPLEAVAIQESLLTDRLLSFINFYGAGFDPEKSTLGRVAEKAAAICRETTKDVEGENLAIAAVEWSFDRNAIIHAIAKSGQGQGPRIQADFFLEHASGVADRGTSLVRAIKNWHRQQLRKPNA